jgi:hypothetical protein
MAISTKKILLILALNACFVGLISAQIKWNKELPSGYENQKDTIFKVYRGDVVRITIDSAYLFNQIRFGDMEKLMVYRDFIRNKDPMAKAFATVLENHSKSLDSLEKYVNLLKINADKSAATADTLISNTIKITSAADIKLEGVNQKLTNAQDSLNLANVKLDHAVKLIKTEIRWGWLKYVGWFVVGGLVGYLLGKK